MDEVNLPRSPRCLPRKAGEAGHAGKAGKPIKSFHDLDVYQSTYKVMLAVFKHILPKLPASHGGPKEEEYDLKDQLRRSAKAIPRLIAEGHSKRHQKKGFQKYLDDAMTESNETIVSLSQVRDLYSRYADISVCNELIDTYDKASRPALRGRQLYNLSLAWTKFSQRKEQRNRVTACLARLAACLARRAKRGMRADDLPAAGRNEQRNPGPVLAYQLR